LTRSSTATFTKYDATLPEYKQVKHVLAQALCSAFLCTLCCTQMWSLFTGVIYSKLLRLQVLTGVKSMCAAKHRRRKLPMQEKYDVPDAKGTRWEIVCFF